MTGVPKRSLNIAGSMTSVSLEDEFWFPFTEAAAQQGKSIGEMAAFIGQTPGTSLASKIRVWLYRQARNGG